MSLFEKTWKALAGLIIMGRKVKKFDPSIFDGKRIAIVGPANSAYNTGKGDYIDSFDYVIRINKSPKLLVDGKMKHDIGSKTDILFHCFFENDHSGGGPLDIPLYDRLGIKYVVNPLSDFFGLRITFNFYKKYLLPKTVYLLDSSYYKQLRQYFGHMRPTTGFFALNTILKSDFSEFYITGFTFFKTAYVDGYRDSMKELAQTQKHIAEAKIHDPEIEFNQFKRLLAENAHKKVLMDPTLARILETN